MQRSGLVYFFLCLSYFALNNVLPAQGFSASAVVGQSWNPCNVEIDIDYQHCTSFRTGKECTLRMEEKYGFVFPTFGFGFYSRFSVGFDTHDLGKVLAVFVGANTASDDPKPVWSANRDHPVAHNATLDLTADGNLELRMEMEK